MPDTGMSTGSASFHTGQSARVFRTARDIPAGSLLPKHQRMRCGRSRQTEGFRRKALERSGFPELLTVFSAPAEGVPSMRFPAFHSRAPGRFPKEKALLSPTEASFSALPAGSARQFHPRHAVPFPVLFSEDTLLLHGTDQENSSAAPQTRQMPRGSRAPVFPPGRHRYCQAAFPSPCRGPSVRPVFLLPPACVPGNLFPPTADGQ